MKPMTRVLNPIVRKVAGKKHMAMAAQIHHVGRRSGRTYVTPTSAHLLGEHFLIPLTFGNRSDWCRNVQAAGGCTIRWKGTDYQVVEPEFLSPKECKADVKAAFRLPERFAARLLGIKQFLRLRVASLDRHHLGRESTGR